MVSSKIIVEWTEAAERDLKIAQEDENKKDRYEYVGFHCQQAAEKFLKAYTVAWGLEFLKTHDLEVLLNICIKKDPEFEKLRENCRLLTPYYIATRYPDFEEKPNLKKQKITEALRHAREIAKLIRQKIETRF